MLTSAWREKQQGRHLVFGSHLCPRQVLRKTLHGTQSSQQLKRTVEKGKSYFMHQIENIFSKLFQKNTLKWSALVNTEYLTPALLTKPRSRGSGCESKRQKFMQTSLCAANYQGFHRLIHKVPHYKINKSISNWFLGEGSAYDFPNLSQQLPMTGEWRGHAFVGDIKQGRRKQRQKKKSKRGQGPLERLCLLCDGGKPSTACELPSPVPGSGRGSLCGELKAKPVMQLLLTLCPGNRWVPPGGPTTKCTSAIRSLLNITAFL